MSLGKQLALMCIYTKKRRPFHYPVQACDSLNILMERLHL